MVEVYIPSALRRYADNKAQVNVKGETVKKALEELLREYPDLRRYIFDDDGRVRGFVNLFVNDRDIKDLNGLETPLKEGDKLLILPAIAGG